MTLEVIQLIRFLVRWFFFLGFIFLVGIGIWAVIVIKKIREEQRLATGFLKTLIATLDLKQAVKEVKNVLDSTIDTK